MNYKQGTASYGVTGIKTITCGWQPVAADLQIGPAGGPWTTVQISNGATDGTNQNCEIQYTDPSRSRYYRYSDRILSVWAWDSGTSTYIEKFRANFDSFTATEFKFDVTIADNSYQVRYRVWG